VEYRVKEEVAFALNQSNSSCVNLNIYAEINNTSHLSLCHHMEFLQARG
jgi:hypothetical protein